VCTSRVPAELLRGNSTNAYIFCRLYRPKAFNRPDHSKRIAEYHRKKLSLNQSLPGLELRTVFGFVSSVPVISSPKRTNFALAPFFYRAWFPSYRNHPHRDWNSGLSRCFDPPMFSSWSQEISVPSANR
jgi:hypothetical protein